MTAHLRFPVRTIGLTSRLRRLGGHEPGVERDRITRGNARRHGFCLSTKVAVATSGRPSGLASFDAALGTSQTGTGSRSWTFA